jgi:hypothetical protein
MKESGTLYTPIYINDPTSFIFCFNRVKATGILVRVEGEEYDACDSASQHWFASGKKGKYGPGLLNTDPKDPRKTERIGLLGEMATGKIIHQPVDLRYRKGGDNCDFCVKGQRIDVKTNSYLREESPSTEIIVYANEYDMSNKINCKYRDMDVYLVSYLKDENREERWAEIVLVGYHLGSIVKKNFESLIRKTRKRGKDHYNIELLYCNAFNLCTFYDWVFKEVA